MPMPMPSRSIASMQFKRNILRFFRFVASSNCTPTFSSLDAWARQPKVKYNDDDMNGYAHGCHSSKYTFKMKDICSITRCNPFPQFYNCAAVIIRHDDDGPHRRMTLMCRQHGGLQPKSVSFGHTKRQMSASWSRLCIFSTLAAMNNVGIEKCQPNVYESSSPAKEKR
eukprot:scaffold11747_cov144-Skeletonema_menzelii.AAC.1